MKLFADDTSIFTVVHDPHTAALDMNHDLNLIKLWAHSWRMSFTVKALLSPRGAYFISDLPEGVRNGEGGLLERGGLFTKSSGKDIFGSFSVLLSHSLRNQGTILRLKYVSSTQFLFQNVPKLTWKVV